MTSIVLRCFALPAFAFVLAAASYAGEPSQPPSENGKADASKYEIIRHLDPFSPLPPKKPEPPPKPKPPEPPPAPPVIEKVNPDNLHLAGAAWDNGSGALVALVEVDGRRTVFLKVGEKIGAFELAAVDLESAEFKDSGGKPFRHPMGTRFHDGVTVVERIKGGGPAPQASAQPVSSAGQGTAPASQESGTSSTLTDEQRREIIERLKAKRAEAQKNN